jgi:hypothetical protein
MTPEMAARFDAWIEENIRGTGLSFNWFSTYLREKTIKTINFLKL